MSANSLPRTERLRSLGAVRRMFESGESGFIFPFRYVWFAEADDRMSAEVLFSVPKKFHKRANRRNLLRRRAKEAYRLQKQIVHNGAPVNLDLALIYSSKEVLPYKTIQNAVRRILEQAPFKEHHALKYQLFSGSDFRNAAASPLFKEALNTQSKVKDKCATCPNRGTDKCDDRD